MASKSPSPQKSKSVHRSHLHHIERDKKEGEKVTQKRKRTLIAITGKKSVRTPKKQESKPVVPELRRS